MKIKIKDTNGNTCPNKKGDIVEPACYHEDTGDVYLYRREDKIGGAHCEKHGTFWGLGREDYEIVEEDKKTEYTPKEGDVVKTVMDCSGAIAGKEYVVTINWEGTLSIGEDIEKLARTGIRNNLGCTCYSAWTLIRKSKDNKNKTNFMSNLKEKFALIFKSEPEKSFRIAGITDGDDLLTEDGKSIFLSYLLTKNKQAFYDDVVAKMIEEDKKKCE